MKKQRLQFNIGDRVSVLDDNLMGFVSSISDSSVFVTTDDDFEIEFDSSELVLMETTLSKA